MAAKKKRTTKSRASKSSKRKTTVKRKTKRTVKKTVKRKTVKTKKTRTVSKIIGPVREPRDDHSVLKEALKDIARELGQLRDEKDELENILDGLAMDITSTQNQEVNLKDQVRKLNSIETALALKRSRLRTNLEKVKTKIQKVRQLSAKMESI